MSRMATILRTTVRRFCWPGVPTLTRRPMGRATRGATCAARLCRAALVLATTVVTLVAASSLLGGPVRLIVVGGNSMLPAYRPGDIVFSWRQAPKQGDVVVYRPAGMDGTVIHRVVDRTDAGLLTRGDANTSLDPWTPAPEEVIGVVRGPRVPLGWFLDRPIWLPAAAVGLLTGFVLWPRHRSHRGARREQAETVVDLTDTDVVATEEFAGLTPAVVAARLDAVLADPQGAAAVERAFADLPVSGVEVASRLNALLARAGRALPPHGPGEHPRGDRRPTQRTGLGDDHTGDRRGGRGGT